LVDEAKMRCRVRRARPSRSSYALAVLGQIRDEHYLAVLAFSYTDVPVGTSRLDVRAVHAGAIRSFAVAAATRFEILLKSIIEERVEVRVRGEILAAAWPAVAAAGAAARDELLAPERQGAPAAVAGCDVDVDFVYEHGLGLSSRPAGRRFA
jgi:hypothetical protein